MADNKKTTERYNRPNIFEVIKPYRKLIFLLIIFALLSNTINLFIPRLIANGIDNFSHGKFAFEKISIHFILAALGIATFTFLQGLLQTYASEKVARDLRNQFINKISHQDYEFIQKSNPSKLLTNLTGDIDSVKMFVSLAVVQLASSIFIIIGASTLLLIINWKLALTVIAIIPIISSAFFIVFRKVSVLFKKSREIIDLLNKVINESIIGAALVRVLNSQMLEFNKFADANTQANKLGISILRFFATLIPIVIFVGNMASMIILLLGGHYVINGSMSLGDFAAFSSYLVLLIFPIMVIGFISNFIAQASVAYGRISQVLTTPDILDEGYLTTPLVGKIELSNVYVNFDQKPILKNISFSLEPGTRTAIIGPTAAGKTQILYLLTGIIKSNGGEVLFDGLSINCFKKENFQHQIGFVFQDSILFNISLRKNIAFNTLVTEESMWKAIETAEIQDFINSLPEGLDTVVSERGSSLSGGQKQRIMLARALAMNPRILLLDDFTARVDTQTEKRILENIEKNYPNITLLSVTQKIASVMEYSQIIVLENGEVISSGNHHFLMSTCPEYVQIFNSQQSTNAYEI